MKKITTLVFTLDSSSHVVSSRERTLSSLPGSIGMETVDTDTFIPRLPHITHNWQDAFAFGRPYLPYQEKVDTVERFWANGERKEKYVSHLVSFRSVVTVFCSCESCALYEKSMETTHVKESTDFMEVTDFMGPLPLSEKGNRYLSRYIPGDHHPFPSLRRDRFSFQSPGDQTA